MKYYNIRQLNQTDCAAACLATISFYYGREITTAKLRDLCGTDILGTSLNGLVLGAEKIGFDVKAVRCTYEQLISEKITYPFIAHGINNSQYSHFIVVYAIKKKYVLVADPERKERKMSIDCFLHFYDGVGVFLKPGSEFIGNKIKGSSMLSRFIHLC